MTNTIIGLFILQFFFGLVRITNRLFFFKEGRPSFLNSRNFYYEFASIAITNYILFYGGFYNQVNFFNVFWAAISLLGVYSSVTNHGKEYFRALKYDELKNNSDKAAYYLLYVISYALISYLLCFLYLLFFRAGGFV